MIQLLEETGRSRYHCWQRWGRGEMFIGYGNGVMLTIFNFRCSSTDCHLTLCTSYRPRPNARRKFCCQLHKVTTERDIVLSVCTRNSQLIMSTTGEPNMLSNHCYRCVYIVRQMLLLGHYMNFTSLHGKVLSQVLPLTILCGNFTFSLLLFFLWSLLLQLVRMGRQTSLVVVVIWTKPSMCLPRSKVSRHTP